MQEFSVGPFAYTPAAAGRWSVYYGNQHLGTRKPESADRSGVIDALADDVSAFVRDASEEHEPDVLVLIDQASDDAIASINVSHWPSGMSAGMINDSSPHWLRSTDRLRSMPVTLDAFAAIAASHAAPARHWITGLLPRDLLTTEPEEWRAPTSWEIRHIVGAGSLTGVTGSQAAALVGVTPQNFRKYTAQDGASTHQKMSFAMWHLLLHRLEVQLMRATQ